VSRLSQLTRDISAASPTFSCPTDCYSSVDSELIDELEQFCEEERRVVRICMHSSPSDDLHNMIIAHPRDWYVRPHANLLKTKAYHAIKGRMLFVGFDEEQTELFRFILDPEVSPVFRLEKGVFIFLWALSDVCIFHEVAIGPFERGRDTVFASWTPTTEGLDARNKYIEKVVKGY
jgi:cupin fold WbuC family metalloprotein